MTFSPADGLPFMKMHGLGNDFVVFDHRDGGRAITAEIARAIGDRHRGVGFDQLAVIESDTDADAKLIFYNADGSLSAACGNATRCIARHLMDETGKPELVLRTVRGMLPCRDAGDQLTSVNMGQPLFDWQDIPLAREVETLHLPIKGDPVATKTCGFLLPWLHPTTSMILASLLIRQSGHRAKWRLRLHHLNVPQTS